MTKYLSLMQFYMASVLVVGIPVPPLFAQVVEGPVIEAEVAPDESAKLPEPEVASTSPPTLGVTVTDSPGDGVLVTSVFWGGPAARAGIRTGDFILSAAGQIIGNPADLRKAVRAANPKLDLEIGFWRKGKEMSTHAALASKFANAKREKAWLGVVLQTTDGDKVLVADVMPASPASRGGIRVGDAILSIDAEKIDSVDELLQLMDRIKAGDNVEVTVLRDGLERTFTVRVGSVVNRTMRWLQDRFPRVQLEKQWFDFAPPNIDSEVYFESFEEMMERLREEVRELREEVRRMRADKQKSEDGQSADEANPADDTSVSSDTSNVMTVALRGARARPSTQANRVRSYRNYRGGRPGVRYRYAYRRGNAYGSRQTYYGRPRGYVYYGTPFYYSYPPAPYFYYYGPRSEIYVGPAFYWY